ncbi:MAG: PQQ-like beta-propeller repeat protein [Verrucomicrobia bacterium]|nr:PQQ-like beta-propeller repeat protein [Verrucomicrobiota bacterium]
MATESNPAGGVAPTRRPRTTTASSRIKLDPVPIPRNALTALLLVAVLTASASAEDWPRFLGPRGDNTSAEINLLDHWNPNGPPIIWEKSVGAGYSAPSVSKDLLVLHHRLGNEEIVEAMDARSGKSKWEYKYPSRFVDPFGYNNGPRATPLLTSNRCFTLGAEGKLLCLDLADGSLVWQRDTAEEWNVPKAFFGVGSTPLLEGDRVIVMVGGQPDTGVVALDPTTGKTIWKNVGRKTWNGVIPVGGRTTKPYEWTGSEMLASYASPVAATIHGQRHLFCLMRQGLVALNPTNGAVRFRRWFQAPVNESVNAMTPVVHDDLVFFSAAYYRVGAVALRVQPDGQSFAETWRSPSNSFERDPATGNYPSPVLEIHFSTPVLLYGFLYAFSGRNEPDATFRCVELQTGALRWSRDEGWPAHSTRQPNVFGRGSAILAEGKLIVLGEGGRLGLFRPNPEKPEELCAWQVPSLRYPCWAGPVLSDRRLFLRSEDKLVCLDWAKPAKER